MAEGAGVADAAGVALAGGSVGVAGSSVGLAVAAGVSLAAGSSVAVDVAVRAGAVGVSVDRAAMGRAVGVSRIGRGVRVGVGVGFACDLPHPPLPRSSSSATVLRKYGRSLDASLNMVLLHERMMRERGALTLQGESLYSQETRV